MTTVLIPQDLPDTASEVNKATFALFTSDRDQYQAEENAIIEKIRESKQPGSGNSKPEFIREQNERLGDVFKNKVDLINRIDEFCRDDYMAAWWPTINAKQKATTDLVESLRKTLADLGWKAVEGTADYGLIEDFISWNSRAMAAAGEAQESQAVQSAMRTVLRHNAESAQAIRQRLESYFQKTPSMV